MGQAGKWKMAVKKGEKSENGRGLGEPWVGESIGLWKQGSGRGSLERGVFGVGVAYWGQARESLAESGGVVEWWAGP